MIFFLRRVIAAMNSRKNWLPLILVLPILYLAWTALTQNTYTVEQNFSITGEVPIAATDNPVEHFQLSQLVSHPDAFFLDRFALLQLNRRLALSSFSDGESDDIRLSRLLLSNMSLNLDTNNETLRISYNGENEALGRMLVTYFSERLQARAEAGRKRLAQQSASATNSQDQSALLPAAALTAEGAIFSSATKSLWRSKRLAPALVLLLLSFVLFAVVIAVLETLDPSFKSERQIARYLGLPVLGALPDANSLGKHLPK